MVIPTSPSCDLRTKCFENLESHTAAARTTSDHFLPPHWPMRGKIAADEKGWSKRQKCIVGANLAFRSAARLRASSPSDIGRRRNSWAQIKKEFATASSVEWR